MPTAPEAGEICLTFDVEERFHSHLSTPDQARTWSQRDRIAQIIDWLAEHDKPATCFVVGELAEQYPDLVKRMAAIGCEVASHTHTHIWIAADQPDKVKDDIRRSKEVLENITGQAVYGFRSPSWSASRSDTWLWDFFVELGLLYDASLFPFRTHMYGSNDNPLDPFWLNRDLMEIPPAVHMFGGVRVPYGGGFYFRALPSWILRRLVRRDACRGRVPVMDFHPWDFEVSTEEPEHGWSNRFIANYNVRSAWDKFTGLIGSVSTRRMIDHYHILSASGNVPAEAVSQAAGQP